MIFIFPASAIIVFIIIVVLLPILAILGSIYSLLNWLLENWYILLILTMIIPTIELLILKKYYKESMIFENIYSKFAKEKKKRARISIFVIIIRGFFIYLSLISFCQFCFTNISGHEIGTLIYTILYFFSLFMTLVSTLTTLEYYGLKKFYLSQILANIFLIVYTYLLTKDVSFGGILLQFLSLLIYTQII